MSVKKGTHFSLRKFSPEISVKSNDLSEKEVE